MSHTRTQTIFAFVTILASLAVLTTNQPLSAQGITHAEIAAIDSIFQPWNDPAGPGAAVAVTRNGRLIYSQGYGSAQLEYRSQSLRPPSSISLRSPNTSPPSQSDSS